MNHSSHSTCPKCHAAIPEDAPEGLCPKCALEGAASVSNATAAGRRSPAPDIVEIAAHFPELEILELIGAGGMGAVYKARQPQLDRFVALKILSHDLAGDPAFVERFNREARVLARLSHPNIVGIHDFGTAGPYCYLTMELVDGVNLRQAMQAGRFTPTEALAMVQHLCSALKFAHEEGILHRDIKPENILIDSKGRVKIADFGIAKLAGSGAPSDVTLTLQGSILGSPHYMAPEQIETPGDIDQRADIYSLGVVLYEMLTGELPIGRFSLPSEKAEMDARIDEIVLRTLAKERQTRFQSAEEFRTEVQALVQSPGAGGTASAPVSATDPGTARFSLVGAILTGLSIVGMIAGVYLANEYRDLGLTRETGRILSILVIVLSAMMAVTGLIFGSIALGSIRKSGGRLGGVGSSVFAVVVWPVLLLGALGSSLAMMPLPDGGGGGSVGFMAVALFIGVSLLLAAFVLVRGLRRWARGVVTKTGEKHFPGLTGTIGTAIGLVVGGVVALGVSSRVFPESERSGRLAEIEREIEVQQRMAERASQSVSSEDIEWYRGAPELTIPLEVHPGFRAELRLVRYENGRILDAAEIGVVEKVPRNAPAKGQVKIGTSGPKGEDWVSERGFTALFLYGVATATTLYSVGDIDEWNINFNQATSVFDAEGLHMIQIATRSDSGTFDDSSIQLEVHVTRE